jgi:thymidine kinase
MTSKKEGRIELMLGTMGADKTTDLIKALENLIKQDVKVKLIKHSADTRYSKTFVVNHTNDYRMAAIAATTLTDIWSNIDEDIQVIGIDEGHFFLDLAEFCKQAIVRGVDVIIAALNGQFDLQPWPAVSSVIPLVEVNMHFSQCTKENCENRAIFAMKTDNTKDRDENGRIIAGFDTFAPRCALHHNYFAWEEQEEH